LIHLSAGIDLKINYIKKHWGHLYQTHGDTGHQVIRKAFITLNFLCCLTVIRLDYSKKESSLKFTLIVILIERALSQITGPFYFN